MEDKNFIFLAELHPSPKGEGLTASPIGDSKK